MKEPIALTAIKLRYLDYTVVGEEGIADKIRSFLRGFPKQVIDYDLACRMATEAYNAGKDAKVEK